MPYSRKAAFCIFLFPALGGLLFGYDIGATSYVIIQLARTEASGVSWAGAVEASAALRGAITSGGVGGAFVGATIVFKVANAVGRRREIMIGAVLYMAGALLEFASGGLAGFATDAASGIALLLLGRFTYGVGCGFVMHGAPSYIAEMAPAEIRGTLVSLKEAMIVVGISLGYAMGYAMANVPGGWRWTYGASMPLSLVLLLAMSSMPPSARWLALRRRDAEAKEALRFVYPDDADELEQAYKDVTATRDEAHGGVSLFDMRYRRALTAGLGVVLLQQFTGQPSVLYYASSIFADAGISTVATVLVGAFKLLATLGAVATVDSRGRRVLLFAGTTTMLVALCGLTLAFYNFDAEGSSITPQKGAIISLLFLYIAGYQYGFGPIAWLLISEVFPLEVRGQAIALAVQANFAANLIVSFLFPVAEGALKGLVGKRSALSAIFAIFAVVDAYSIYFVYHHVPETKGMSLEQIETFLAGDAAPGYSTAQQPDEIASPLLRNV
ncbi:general sugar transporter [Pelagophyceae sp. CCMP2097]|nr:general sugar transporter [Pelagophyceae sp. CCMP2097]|mmetsp:Transcript_27706/g.93086  ORF Transcript_27706/g.93086 Transcript_27706/m.93086 type:complete len:498 (-) Transcript_27706:1081-2574(-)